MTRTHVAALAAALLLTACASGQPQASSTPTDLHGELTPTPEPLPTWTAADGPASWVCEYPQQGVTYAFDLPTDMSNKAIQDVEALRKEAGLEGQPGYLLVTIDATQAVDANSGALYNVQWATADQESRGTKDVSDALGVWRNEAIPDTSKPGMGDLYNKFINLSNAQMKTSPNRGAKGYELHVVEDHEGPIDSMVAPVIYPSGFDNVPCVLKK